MKKLFFLLLVLAMAVSAFAELKVTGKAPTVTGPGSDLLNQQTKAAFEEIIAELNNQFTYNNPKKFVQGMGNSSVYASHGATTRGYGGYKLFSATIGTTVGLQLPRSLNTIMNDLDDIANSFEKDGDIKLGLSPNFFNANVGLNMGIFKFLPNHLGFLKRDNLYVGLQIGYFKLPSGIFDNISYKSFTLGTTVNYQIIPTVSLGSLITWRGLNLGTGFIYSSSSFGISGLSLGEPIEKPVAGGVSLVADAPEVYLNADVTTFTIPLEAVTAIKLLIFNIPFGVGADIAFGRTSLSGGISSDIKYKGLPSTYKEENGELAVSGGVSNSPSIFNFKIMTGLGINAGPVVFDFPITIYPANNGYAMGLTVGAVY